MSQFNIYEAKAQFSRLIDRALAGEEVVVAKAGRPLIRFVPVVSPGRRTGGGLRGLVEIAEDFDAPMSEADLLDFEGGPLEPSGPRR